MGGGGKGFPSCGGSDSGGLSGTESGGIGRSGTHGGTIGTPEGEPLLDCDVPISLPCLDRILYRLAYLVVVDPGGKNWLGPWLIANFWNYVGFDLYGWSVLQKCSEPLSLWSICLRYGHTCIENRRCSPFLLLASAC